MWCVIDRDDGSCVYESDNLFEADSMMEYYITITNNERRYFVSFVDKKIDYKVK